MSAYILNMVPYSVEVQIFDKLPRFVLTRKIKSRFRGCPHKIDPAYQIDQTRSNCDLC